MQKPNSKTKKPVLKKRVKSPKSKSPPDVEMNKNEFEVKIGLE